MKRNPDGLPPMDIADEECALGALMLCGDDRATFTRARRMLWPGAFTLHEHQTIFRVLCQMDDEGVPIDAVTFRARLKSISGGEKETLLDEIGGVAEIAKLLNRVPSHHNAPSYAAIVAKMAQGRSAISVASKLVQDLKSAHDDASEVIQGAIEKLWAEANRGRDIGIWSIGEATAKFVEDRMDGTKSPAMLTGINSIDRDYSGVFTFGGYTLIAARPSMGKAQPLWSNVLTPSGWRKMGELREGCAVIGADGKPHSVTGVFPQGLRMIYRVRFADGGSTECCDEHLWFTTTRRDRKYGNNGSVKRLEEIRKSLRSSEGRLNHFVPYVKPVHFNVCPRLPIHPYLLGIYLGDGNMNPSVIITNPEPDIADKIRDVLHPGDRISETTVPLRVPIVRGIRSSEKSATAKALTELGLNGCDSFTKFIPGQYLLAPVDMRLELLRGLFDSDGYVTDPNGGSIEFSTVSARLREGVAELARSLGGRVTWKEKRGRYRKGGVLFETATYFRMNISFANDIVPVSSAKHLKKWRGLTRKTGRAIESVEPAGYAECQCITIDAADSLYVTDDYVVTHNSTFIRWLLASLASQGTPCGLIAIEENRDKIAGNVLSNLSGVENAKLAYGRLGHIESSAVADAVSRTSRMPLWGVDTALTVPDVMSAIEMLVTQKGCKVVAIDHIHLLGAGKRENRNDELRDISSAIKSAFKRLRPVGIVAAQLSRPPEKGREPAPPHLSDLRESGSLEEHADAAIMLHRRDYYHRGERNYSPDHLCQVFIRKNRNGAVGEIVLRAELEYQRFVDESASDPWSEAA